MGTVKKLVTLNESVARELEIVAKALNKTQREIIESALDFYFDYTDSIIADQITREIKEGRMKVYDADQVYAELGIEVED